MLEPAIPENEAERLAALRSLSLLDSAKEQRFERITRSAALLLKVPIALVTLIDAERQWFKSRYGLFVAETPRRESFCGHAILHDEVMVVEDAQGDERFRDNPLVTGAPYIRFYAGRPLRAPGAGHRVGTLCLIDREPRRLSESELLTLDDLAHWAETELDLGARERAADRHLSQLLDYAVQAALWADPKGRVLWTNRRLQEITGWSSGELAGRTLGELMQETEPLLVGPDGKSNTGPGVANVIVLDRHGRRIPASVVVVEGAAAGEQRFTILFGAPAG